MKSLSIILLMLTILIIQGCGESGVGPRDYQKGLALLRAGDPTAAIKTFNTMISEDADTLWGTMGKAAYFECEGFEYDAFNAYKSILLDTTDFHPALVAYVRMCLSQGLPHYAKSAAEKAYKLDAHSPEAMAVLLKSLIAGGENKAVDLGLQEGFEISPDNSQLLLAKAEYYLNIGDPDAARAACHEVLDTDYRDSVLLNVANIYGRLGYADSASSFYQAAIKEGSDNYYILAGAADGFNEIGYFDDTRKVIEKLRQSKSPSFRKFRAEKNMYVLLDKPFSGFFFFLDVYRLYGHVSTAIMELGELKISIGYSKIAEAHFDQALIHADLYKYSPNEKEYIDMHRAEKYFDNGEAINASARISGILDNPSEDYRVRRIAALYYGLMAEKEEAARMYEYMERIVGSNAFLRADLADVYRRLDSLDRAGEIYESVLNLKKFDYRSILGQLDVFDRSNDPVGALEFLEKLDPAISMYRPVAIKKFTYLMELNRYDDAYSFANAFIDKGPGSTERYLMAEKAARVLGNVDTAEKAIMNAAESNPENARAKAELAWLYYYKGMTAEAEEAVNSALMLDTLQVDAILLRARLLSDAGMSDSAVVLYNNLVLYDEYIAPALYNLALENLKPEGSTQKARSYILKATNVEKENVIYLMTLGRVQNQMETYNIARLTYERALGFEPDNAELNYYAGLNYIDAGKKSEAKNCLNKAVRLGLNAEQKSAAQEALKKL